MGRTTEINVEWGQRLIFWGTSQYEFDPDPPPSYLRWQRLNGIFRKIFIQFNVMQGKLMIEKRKLRIVKVVSLPVLSCQCEQGWIKKRRKEKKDKHN